MVKEITVTAKTVREAVESGARQLGVSQDAVQYEVLEEPKKGFLGIGAADAKVSVKYTLTAEDRARAFLTELFESMNMEVSMTFRTEEETLFVDLSGDNMGLLIGRRGECLDSLQYLTGIVVNRGEEEYTRVTLDIKNYRAKREETLVNLANKVAQKVIKYRRSVTLEPMNPYERRIIHSTLQNFKGVTTYSTGTEPSRRVVVAYAGSGSPAPRRSAAPARDNGKSAE